MLLREAVEEYHYSLLENTPKTQAWAIQCLEKFATWCEREQIPLDKLRPYEITKFIEELRTSTNPRNGKPLSTYTLHGYAQCIKTFLNWCARERYVEPDVPRRITMPRVEVKIIQTFTPGQIAALFEACARERDPSLAVRDKAILSVLLDTGIRASELINLTLDCAFIRPNDAYLLVHGKGNKWREVGLGRSARTALFRYITRHRRADKEEKHVFLNRNGQPLTVSGLDQLLERLRDWGHVKGVRVSAHSFRHTFACRYLLNGGDLYKLSRLLGHTSTSVTEGYLRAIKAKEARIGRSVLDDL